MVPMLVESQPKKPISSKKQGSKSSNRENSGKRPKSKQGKKDFSVLAVGHRQASQSYIQEANYGPDSLLENVLKQNGMKGPVQ